MNEQDILRFMDGRSGGDESRRLLDELRTSGQLGEVLLSEAASAMLDSVDGVACDLSPEEVVELRRLQERALSSEKSTVRLYAVDDEQLPLAAESETTYGD